MRGTVAVKCPRCNTEGGVCGTIDHDPGVRTFRNGDPGYPPDTQFEHDPCTNCGVSEFTDEEFQAMCDEGTTGLYEREEPDDEIELEGLDWDEDDEWMFDDEQERDDATEDGEIP